MRFGAAGGGAGAGGALYREHVAGAGDPLQAREHIEKRSHVRGFLLHPDDVSCFAVAGEFGNEFFFREGIELFEKHDGGGIVFSLLAFGLEFVADFAGADQDAVGFTNFCVGENALEIFPNEICNRR